MPVKVVETVWVAYQAKRVEGLLLARLPREQAWPDQKLREFLAEEGLEFQVVDFQRVKAKLIADGILAEVS